MATSAMQKFTGTKLMASENENSKSNGSSIDRSRRRRALNAVKARFVLCTDSGDSVDLEPRKVYQVLGDREAVDNGLIRVIDDSGDDYLFPIDWFIPIRIPTRSQKMVRELV